MLHSRWFNLNAYDYFISLLLLSLILLLFYILTWNMGFPGGSDGKESTCNVGDLGSILGLGRSPGEGHGNPLQYSCLEKPHAQRSLASYSPWICKELDTIVISQVESERPQFILVSGNKIVPPKMYMF